VPCAPQQSRAKDDSFVCVQSHNHRVDINPVRLFGPLFHKQGSYIPLTRRPSYRGIFAAFDILRCEAHLLPALSQSCKINLSFRLKVSSVFTLARIHGAANPQRERKANSKAAKPSRTKVPKSQNDRLRFQHLCDICYALTSRISNKRPTIPAADEIGLRFQRAFSHSRTSWCGFCAFLFQSWSAQKVEGDLRKPVDFLLATSGPEHESSEELHGLY